MKMKWQGTEYSGQPRKSIQACVPVGVHAIPSAAHESLLYVEQVYGFFGCQWRPLSNNFVPANYFALFWSVEIFLLKFNKP